MEPNELRAHLDFRRVSACVEVIFERYAWTIVALWASQHWLDGPPMYIADSVVILAHVWNINRLDAKVDAALKTYVQS